MAGELGPLMQVATRPETHDVVIGTIKFDWPWGNNLSDELAWSILAWKFPKLAEYVRDVKRAYYRFKEAEAHNE